MVVDVEILPHRRVEDELVDGEHGTYDLGLLRAGRCRDGEDERVSEGRERGVERGVGAAVARPGQGDVMGLVDDNEPDAARLRETRGVYGEELGRGEHAVTLPSARPA